MGKIRALLDEWILVEVTLTVLIGIIIGSIILSLALFQGSPLCFCLPSVVIVICIIVAVLAFKKIIDNSDY